MNRSKTLIFVLIFLVLTSIPLASAVSNLDIPLPTALGNSFGTYKAGTDISLVQICTNLTDFCDECNLTSLKYPDGTIIAGGNIQMTKSFSLFNFTLGKAYTEKTGKYTVTGFCDAGGVFSPWAYNFEIVQSVNNNITLIIFLFLVGLVLLMVGFVFDNEFFGLFAGLLLTVSGVYTMIYGIGIVNDVWTRFIASVVLGVGLIVMFAAMFEIMKGEGTGELYVS